ncbi:MAG TPA: FCD domain-containing protein [Trebonia sp.]|jgi:DNA-binding FadR family transcriptional regulator|nr:FCD domain-containing protein [Trebonia sp.]
MDSEGVSQPVLSVSRGRQLARQILADSERAGLGPGSRLPTERQLALDLGVTRGEIRHALAALEAEGLISREVGRGTFLRAGAEDDPTADLGRPSAGTDFAPADVMTIRRLLEPQAMPLVVIWATARDFGEMDRCLTGGDAATSFEEFETWDLALHRCIMAAAHSPLLAALYGFVESARHGQVWGDLKRRSTSRLRRELYQEDHHSIVEELRARDADAAIEAMRRHLARVAEHLLGAH